MKAGKFVLATVLAGAISILIAVLGQTWWSDEKASSISLPGLPKNAQDPLRHLPAFSLRDLDGQEIASSAWAGKVVILSFWATWCLPCLSGIPLLQEAHAASDQVRVIGVTIDTQEEVARYLAKNPVKYPILLGGTEAVELSRRLGNRLEGLPFTVIFDRQGRRVQAYNGEVTQAFLAENLAPLLAEAPRTPSLAN